MKKTGVTNTGGPKGSATETEAPHIIASALFIKPYQQAMATLTKGTTDVLNTVICGDSKNVLASLDTESVDLVVTSPPYDNLRDYEGFSFDFEGIAKELARVIKRGGVIVWVVGDQTKDGSESGTSFKQALYFKELGLNLHDTMIYHRVCPFPANVRYNQDFEYMFVLSKGTPKTFNPVVKEKKSHNSFRKGIEQKTYRDKTGKTAGLKKNAQERLLKSLNSTEKTAGNVWYIPAGFGMTTTDKGAYEHPAMFPEQLAKNHIISWSNEGDLVLDPFNGSGTTTKCAKYLNRNFIGIDISEKYCEIARKRLLQEMLF